MGIGSRLACGLSPVVQRGGRRAASHAPPLSLHRLLPLQPGTAHRKHLSQVPDYEAKYRDKLLRRAREAGVGTVEELKRQMAATAPEAEPQPAAKAAHTAKAADSAAAQPQKCAQDLPQRRAQDLPPSVKRLDQVMKTDLLGDKSGDEIGEIWTQYHATKDAVSAVIPAHTYQQLLRVARANPLF
ncbi:ATP synthase mitochondrial F1 complex assembly factor 1, partial [Coemansia sp. RSA 2708]